MIDKKLATKSRPHQTYYLADGTKVPGVTRYKMSEKQKAIYLEEWLIEAIQREAEKHHRSWMREVQAILEEVIFDRQNTERVEAENK